MNIDPYQIATQGVGPGWSTFGFATQGFGFEIEVIVQPVTGGGGGWTPDYEQYEIIVRIKYKGKVWEEKRFISGLMGKSLEKVFAKLKRIYHLPIRIKVTEVSLKVKNIILNVFSKDDKYNKH